MNEKKTDVETTWRAFYEREVWWIYTGVNIGVEINGAHEHFLRPVIVVRKFNKDMALVVPTTTQDKKATSIIGWLPEMITKNIPPAFHKFVPLVQNDFCAKWV